MTKILIADDDQAIREMLRMMLETFNYEVMLVNDGKEALDVIQASQDRLIVMLDLFMPRLDGRQILRAIASDATLSAQHTYILLTANHNLSLSEYNDAPFHLTLLTKPFAMDDLLHIVDEAAQRLRIPQHAVTHCK